ncbi:MAG TPA: ATP-binding cassette domain-containing protein, partial [Streptosporangiaceae bacterium]
MTTDTSALAGRHPTDGLAVDAANVDVTYRVRGTDRLTVRDVSFQIGPRESFGLVGESGCGKTTMALAIVRYLARNGRVSAGSITVAGQDVEAL